MPGPAARPRTTRAPARKREHRPSRDSRATAWWNAAALRWGNTQRSSRILKTGAGICAPQQERELGATLVSIGTCLQLDALFSAPMQDDTVDPWQPSEPRGKSPAARPRPE